MRERENEKNIQIVSLTTCIFSLLTVVCLDASSPRQPDVSLISLGSLARRFWTVHFAAKDLPRDRSIGVGRARFLRLQISGRYQVPGRAPTRPLRSSSLRRSRVHRQTGHARPEGAGASRDSWAS
jgi:hypothetical protein